MDMRRPPGNRSATVRVRPAPRAEPPYDDEAPQPSYGMDMLPLAWSAQTARPRTRRHHQFGRGRRAGQQHPDGCAARPDSQASRLALLHFVRTAIEVVNGFRPLNQIVAMTHPRHAAEVTNLVRTARAQAGYATGAAVPVTVRRVRMCEPGPTAVEAAVVLDLGRRSRAVMLRLERDGATWACHLARLI